MGAHLSADVPETDAGAAGATGATGAADAAAHAEPDPRRWFVLAVCLSALFVTLLDATIINVALPSIGSSLHADPADQQWVVSGYILSFATVPIIAGRLGDDRGRRRMLLGGIGGFVATSLLAGLAPTAGILIGARVLQGVAGGLVNPQVSGLIQQMFRGAERARAFGLLGLNVGLAQAIGPVLGGIIVTLGGGELGWRLTFLINVPVGLTAFVLASRLLPRDRRVEHARPLDLPGVGLLALGMVGLLYPIVEYDADRSGRRLLLVVPAIAVLGLFVGWERGPGRRRGYPLIDTALFRIRSYADGVGLALLFFAGWSGTALVLSLFLQDGLGFRPWQSGLTASALAAGFAIGAPLAGRLVPRLGRSVSAYALAVYVVGVLGAVVAVRAATASLGGLGIALLLVAPLFLAGLGGGGVITPNQVLSLAEVDVAGGSTAGGMLQTAQRVGIAIGAAALTAVFYGSLAGTRASGPARIARFGDAYSVALVVTLVLGVAALALAVFDARTERRRA